MMEVQTERGRRPRSRRRVCPITFERLVWRWEVNCSMASSIGMHVALALWIMKLAPLLGQQRLSVLLNIGRLDTIKCYNE
jgi:hypothetical protein